MDKELKKISSKIADYSTLEKENRNAAYAFGFDIKATGGILLTIRFANLPLSNTPS